jgi:hypothetical protein
VCGKSDRFAIPAISVDVVSGPVQEIVLAEM